MTHKKKTNVAVDTAMKHKKRKPGSHVVSNPLSWTVGNRCGGSFWRRRCWRLAHWSQPRKHILRRPTQSTRKDMNTHTHTHTPPHTNTRTHSSTRSPREIQRRWPPQMSNAKKIVPGRLILRRHGTARLGTRLVKGNSTSSAPLWWPFIIAFNEHDDTILWRLLITRVLKGDACARGKWR